MEIQRTVQPTRDLRTALTMLILCALSVSPATAATILYRHGEILTQDPAQPRAESLVTVDERIVYVGPDAGVTPWLSRADRVVELNGRTLLPGFQPVWTARAGAQQLLEQYRALELGVDDYEGPRFKRIAHLQRLMGEGRIDRALRWAEGARS